MLFFKDVKKYKNYIIYATKASLKAEVAGSYLNWLWWIVEPLCFMFIYALIFGVVFGVSEQYFPAFVFIGITMWNFFSNVLTASTKIVKRNKSIISRIYLPKHVLIIVNMCTNAFKMGISFLIVIGMLVFFRITPNVKMLMIFPVLIVMLVFTFGFSLLLMNFGVYVEDLSKVIKIVLRALFYLTGIFYDVEKRIGNAFSKTVAEILTKANPMALSLSSARKCLLYNEMPDVLWLLIWLLIGLLLCALGIHLVYKNENSYVKII